MKIACLNRESTKSENSESKSIPLSVYQKIKKKIGYKTVSSLKRFGMTYLASIWAIRLLSRHCDISKDFRVEIRAIHRNRSSETGSLNPISCL